MFQEQKSPIKQEIPIQESKESSPSYSEKLTPIDTQERNSKLTNSGSPKYVEYKNMVNYDNFLEKHKEQLKQHKYNIDQFDNVMNDKMDKNEEDL